MTLNPSCAGCGKVMGKVRSNRRTCDSKCRQLAFRRRRRDRDFYNEYPLLRPELAIANQPNK